jgi:hypothetical protein
MRSEVLGCELRGDYLSVTSKWIHKNKYYGVNIFTSAILRGIWLTKNKMIFDKHAWLDVKVILPDHGMEVDIQGGQEAGDDDMVIFFREADPGTIED